MTIIATCLTYILTQLTYCYELLIQLKQRQTKINTNNNLTYITHKMQHVFIIKLIILSTNQYMH